MVNDKIVKLIQDTADSFISSTGVNYNSKYSGYTCVVHNEVDYQFKSGADKLIEANLLFGSAQKNNDIENKYSMNFVVNIQSEINGWEIAKSLFDDIFKVLTRTYQTLGDYKAKIFFTSPVITNPYAEIEDNFICLMTMNGSVEFSETIVLGTKYELSLDNVNYYEIKPRQPYIMKEATGGNDPNYSNQSLLKFSKASNEISIQLTLIYEKIIKTSLTTDETNFNTLMNKLLDECYGATTQTYYYKETVGSGTTAITKSISGLICVRGQKVYDETTGENVLSIQLKVGA